ncbi:MAG: hypothetical protein HY861_01270 [Chlamydiia bacterium]|nr:hypothetical protein [Chlamydiia bacterium]
MSASPTNFQISATAATPPTTTISSSEEHTSSLPRPDPQSTEASSSPSLQSRCVVFYVSDSPFSSDERGAAEESSYPPPLELGDPAAQTATQPNAVRYARHISSPHSLKTNRTAYRMLKFLRLKTALRSLTQADAGYEADNEG